MTIETEFAPAERLDKEDVLQQYQLVKNSKELVGEIFDKIPVIILILNRYRQMVYANKYFKKIVKLDDLSGLIGLRPGEIFTCVHSDETPGGCGTTVFCKNCGAVNAILASLKGVGDIRECEIYSKKGDILNLLVSAEPVESYEDFIVFTIQDIEDSKKRIMLENVFFGIIKKNLSELKIISNMLNERYSKDEFVKEVDNLALKTLKEIEYQQLILNAVNFKIKVNPVIINSLELINEMKKKYNMNKEIVKESHYSISVDFITDYFLITTIFENIISFARKEKKELDSIIINSKQLDNNVIFEIHYNKFIPKSVQLEFFKQNKFQTSSTEELNFYLIKLLVTNYLKGDVNFISTEKEGTTFFVSLPLDLSREISLGDEDV